MPSNKASKTATPALSLSSIFFTPPQHISCTPRHPHHPEHGHMLSTSAHYDLAMHTLDAGVDLFNLYPARPTISVHPEAKAWIVKYVETEQPALAKKTSVLFPGMYNSNRMPMPRHDNDTDTYKFNSPVRASIHLPLVDPLKSTGPFVHELIEDELPGAKLLAYEDYLTVGEIVEK